MKQLIKTIINGYYLKQCHKISKTFYANVVHYNPQLKEKAEGEEEWMKRWKRFDRGISPLGYRIFSRYIGNNIDIVPLEICSNVVEPVLTPYHFNNYYSDKNSFDNIFPQFSLPKTFLRKIRGRYSDANYNPIDIDYVDTFINAINCVEIIVKPAISSSGKGVELFRQNGFSYVNAENVILSKCFIDKFYPDDCIIQERFVQHDFFSFFNESSVNSVRIATYRDSFGKIHALNSFLRIGYKGSIVDNAHAGGMFVGVNADGRLGKYVCDQYGRINNVFNGIDFAKESFTIPKWDIIKDRVIDLSKYVIHHDLIAWDAILDKDGEPHILEVNVGGYGGWAFQFTSGPMFGDYTEDVIMTAKQMNDNTELKIFLTRK